MIDPPIAGIAGDAVASVELREVLKRQGDAGFLYHNLMSISEKNRPFSAYGKL